MFEEFRQVGTSALVFLESSPSSGHLAHPSTGHGVSVRPRLYRTQRTSAPNPASDHMRVATHSSRATATKIAAISAPMILAIAVPSSVSLIRAGTQ